MPETPVLELRRVHAAYGQIEVLHGIDLAVSTGSVLALLGPNGAGKSTTLRVASGQMEPTKGCFHVLGRHANGMRPDALARAGLCTLPDGRGIFPNLTVTENLRLMTFGGPSRAKVEEQAFGRFPRLAERRHQVAGTLSGGEQQMLAMARTLSVEPAVLLLDEISMGLAPMIVAELYELVGADRRRGRGGDPRRAVRRNRARRRHRRRRRRAGPDRGGGQARRLARRPDRRLPRGGRRMSPRHRRRTTLRRRLPALAAGALLLVGGGSGLLAAALSNGPAGADSPLGGFTVTALAEGLTAQYEQPNFPLPATPSLEFDEGYAATSDNFGPSGTATASSLYPGQVVANAGPELGLLVPGLPLPPAPVWPLQATSEYPQAPNSGSTDAPGVNMDTASTANGNTASATLGDGSSTAGSDGASPTQTAPSGSGNPLAGSSALMGVGTLSATSSSSTPGTSATSTASATMGGVSLLAGLITIGTVTSTATATSDGTTGKVTGSTLVQNMAIAGEQVTVDANGIKAAGQSDPLSLPISSINTLLNELGISMSLTNADRHGQRRLGQPDPRRAQDHRSTSRPWTPPPISSPPSCPLRSPRSSRWRSRTSSRSPWTWRRCR